MADQLQTSKADAYVIVGPTQAREVVSKFDAYVLVGPPPRRRGVTRMYVLTTPPVAVPLP